MKNTQEKADSHKTKVNTMKIRKFIRMEIHFILGKKEVTCPVGLYTDYSR